jgi:hypothetical protein
VCKPQVHGNYSGGDPSNKAISSTRDKTTIGRKYAENLMWNFIALILGRRLESVYVKLLCSNTVILGGIGTYVEYGQWGSFGLAWLGNCPGFA